MILSRAHFQWKMAALVALSMATAVMYAKEDSDPVAAIADRRLEVATPRGSGELALYVSRDWSKPQPAVKRALLIFHGGARNAVDYDHSGATAIDATSLVEQTILIAPQFLGEQDLKAFGMPATVSTLRWRDNAWEGGQDAIAPAPVSSFDAIDAILKRLADRTIFPNLKMVVLAGHSGGGQILQRYAVVGRGEKALVNEGVHVRYVVANPSSYVYFNDERPAGNGDFAPYHGVDCPDFNHWKHGVIDPPPYVGSASFKDIEDEYASRDVVNLLGMKDIDPQGHGLDRSCAGEAEGPYRFARGTSYFHYMEMRHPQRLKQRLWDVPGVGHDNYKMFNSSCGLAALFDIGMCTTPGK